MNQEELEFLYKQIESYHSTDTRNIKFDLDSNMTPIDFISCFVCQLQHKEKTEASVDAARTDKNPMELTVHMKQGLTDARRLKLGRFLLGEL